MAYYISVTVIALILMVAMSIHVLTYSGFNKSQKKWFVATFSAISFCALAELALHCGYYHHSLKIPLSILTVLQFALAPCFAMLFAGALGLNYQFKIFLITFGSFLLLGTVCAPFKLVFYFDDDGYHRGPYFLIYVSTYIAGLLYNIGALFIVGKKFNHRDIATIIMVLVVLVAGIIPMTLFELHIAYVSVAVSASLCYIFYNDLVQEDTKSELVEKSNAISKMQTQIITRLANLIESRDTETGHHVARTSYYVKTLAQDALKDGVYSDIITPEFINTLVALAPLHDVGKILISDKILLKPGKLTEDEFEEIKKHASLGGQVINEVLDGVIDKQYTQFGADIATYHHEKWDGSGYPEGLKGEEIPLSARIMALADVFDALVSKRCYKEPYSIEEAFDIIRKEEGSHFDPKLVSVFLSHKDHYLNPVISED